ncbi:MAG TPA: short chain dehydrogenase [Balneolaceae bacterium]|nr:short chain dehydrogenase [Balneolaceae bacterium]
MKIIIVGATGTIGKKVTANLKQDHEIIKVGSKSGDIQADITKPETLKNLFEKAGSFDALVSTTGVGHFGPLKEMTAEDFKVGLHSKLLGQINLVLTGQHYIKPKGSFTLVSGILSNDPVADSVNVSTVNSAINGFVNAAAQELENDVRINVVSPGVVEDSPELFEAFPGHIPVSMDRVVQAFRKSVLGVTNGEVIEVW